MESRWFTRWI